MDITCSVCHQKFQNEMVFTNHFVTKHTAITLVPQEITSNSQCQIIDKSEKIVATSPDAGLLPSRKPKLCEICGFRSSKPSLYASHILTHIGAMPYFCQYCTFSTISRFHLQEHMSCHKIVIQNRIRNGWKTYKSKLNMHECECCTAVFANWIDLTEHYMQHLKKMPFKCNICRFLFSERKDYIIHSHLHKIVLVCGICHIVFNSRADYFDHVLSHNTSKMFRKFDRVHFLKRAMDSGHTSPQIIFCDGNNSAKKNFNQQSKDFSHKYVCTNDNSSTNSTNRKDMSKASINTKPLPDDRLVHKINATNLYVLKNGVYEITDVASLCNKKDSGNKSVLNLMEFQKELNESCNKVVGKTFKVMPLDKSNENAIVPSKNCDASSKLKELSVSLIRLPRSVQGMESYRAFCSQLDRGQMVEENCRKSDYLTSNDKSKNCNLQMSLCKTLNEIPSLQKSSNVKKVCLQNNDLIHDWNSVLQEDGCINVSGDVNKKKKKSVKATNFKSFDELGETTESCESTSDYEEDSFEKFLIETRDEIQHNNLDMCSSFNNQQKHSYVTDNLDNNTQIHNCKQAFVLAAKLPEYVHDMSSFKRFSRISKQRKKLHDKSSKSQNTSNFDQMQTSVSSKRDRIKSKLRTANAILNILNLKRKCVKVKNNSSPDNHLNTENSVTVSNKITRKFNFLPESISACQFKNNCETYSKQSLKSSHQKSTTKKKLLHVSKCKKLFVELHRLPDIVCEKYRKQKPLMISNIYPLLEGQKSLSSGKRLYSDAVLYEHNYCVSSKHVKTKLSNS
ncbi:uncharacterized protein NPIL_215031 [Nephila pilipes]|uniref:C2H2-type domain-containing protein n=1 Tax=Nephila pilipes TaxID=299642 RepID=A0A8X6NPJ5_NEPPI|nr:uncharacterized protein NPIL_215031 [Nephila pilipes]